ncbi:MAG: RNA-binding protein [Pikeienuella sp.]
MTRGGRRKEREGPERRCIATGASGPTARLIRFVRGPGDAVVPDLAERLPGRGVWLTADRVATERAVAKKLFARAFRGAAHAQADLADHLERLLAERLIATVALARKAGQAVTGYEKTRALLQGGNPGVLLEAADGAAGGREKLARLVAGLPRIGLLTAAELGLAFGREFAIHAVLEAGGVAERAVREADRLSGFRGPQNAVPAAGAEQEMRARAEAGLPSDDTIETTGPADGPIRDSG